MAFGKIYSYEVRIANTTWRNPRANTPLVQGNPRTTALLAVAKANNIDIEIVHTEPAKGVSDDYKKLNKLGKVPTFQGQDGYVLTECMAIAIYRTSTT